MDSGIQGNPAARSTVGQTAIGYIKEEYLIIRLLFIKVDSHTTVYAPEAITNAADRTTLPPSAQGWHRSASPERLENSPVALRR